ncbi:MULTISPECIES: AAA family ATPase [Streptacidiphilus]|uniref:AAA family ATPase n=1 Tax=Streptacidiphilus cavernicola TaxID=3342716 RepID=A0ABV6UPN2_9ACTN|nr:AAA family ATPase [Streptacidiphilus jeojiense]
MTASALPRAAPEKAQDDRPGDPILIVLRGPSAVGKTTLAKRIRAAYERRNLALVHQDVVRRELLREPDVPGGHNIDLIREITGFALGRGFHTVLEGILDAGRYGPMLTDLRAAHTGPQHWFYLHAPFETTVERHNTKPSADEIGVDLLRSWYRELDLLPAGLETVIGPENTVEQTLARILRTTRLMEH